MWEMSASSSPNRPKIIQWCMVTYLFTHVDSSSGVDLALAGSLNTGVVLYIWRHILNHISRASAGRQYRVQIQKPGVGFDVKNSRIVISLSRFDVENSCIVKSSKSLLTSKALVSSNARYHVWGQKICVVISSRRFWRQNSCIVTIS